MKPRVEVSFIAQKLAIKEPRVSVGVCVWGRGKIRRRGVLELRSRAWEPAAWVSKSPRKGKRVLKKVAVTQEKSSKSAGSEVEVNDWGSAGDCKEVGGGFLSDNMLIYLHSFVS